MKAIGLDIGTTTICAILMDARTGEHLDSQTLPNDTAISGGKSYERLQDPDKILDKCKALMSSYTDRYDDVACVGISAQMHGMLYVNSEGKAVSPFYIWQDRRGDEIDFKTGISYARELSDLTGYPMATGFGLTTHYFNTKNNLVPETAVSFCNIGDYVGRNLTGVTGGAIHQSIAASFGLYDLENGCFDKGAAEKAGMDADFLPEVTSESTVYGKTKEGIPVALSFGDNQASFLGSVNNECKVLLNVGTGGQLSAYSKTLMIGDEIESRPFVEDSYLLVGSALCAGYSYSLMKKFIEEVLDICGAKADRSLYEIMNEAAAKANQEEKQLTFDTRFSGTRKNPEITGSITGLTVDTFNPGQMILGVLKGICTELFNHYDRLPKEVKDAEFFVGSGNGIRMNHLLQQICCEKFGMKMRIPGYSEEAACGSALFAMLASGIYSSLEDVQKLIKYQ